MLDARALHSRHTLHLESARLRPTPRFNTLKQATFTEACWLLILSHS